MPEFSGVSHVTLTVVDLPAARTFWTEIMGLEVRADGDKVCLLIHPSGVIIGLRNQNYEAEGPFDEHHVGLDHFALGADSRDELDGWVAWFAANDVPYSPIAESPFGYHLNFRAPDNLPVELFALR
jgi:glyoxylase I family protein